MPAATRSPNTEKMASLPEFFTAMLRALQLEGADTSGLGRLSAASWHDLLEFCDLSHLTLPLLQTFQNVAPEWVVARVQSNRADNTIRVKRIAAAYIEIKKALANAGIEHLVIKGFSQYPNFVKAQEDRMQSDIDLYCPQDHLRAAREALMGLGYEADRTLKKYPADHLPEMTRKRGWVWRGNMYDPEMPPAVDLHYCFWNHAGTRLPVQGVSQFWERRINRHDRDLSFPALCGIDHLAFCALHILRDLQRGDWVLHHVYELAWFLHTHVNDQEFWALWKVNHDDTLRSLQLIAFWLAREWFHCRWAEAVDCEMARMPQPISAWLERFGRSPLTGMFYPNKHGVWLHLALLDSHRDKLLTLGGALAPFRLPIVGAPGQAASKTRRTRSFWPSHRYPRYLLHIVLRAAFHLQTSTDTLWHGFCWWRHQREHNKCLWRTQREN